MSALADPHVDLRKRVAVRLAHSIEAVFVDQPDGVKFHATVADLSDRGMRLLLHARQHLTPKTRFTFTLLDSPSIVVYGEVRWSRPATVDEMEQCGVLYLNMTEDHRRRLEDFLERKMQAAGGARLQLSA